MPGNRGGRGRRRKGRKNNNGRNGKRYNGSAKTVAVTTLGAVVPNSMLCKMHFTDTTELSLVSAGAFTSVRYRFTSAFDVDPVIGSTTMPGFAEMAALYNMYRVISGRIKVIFCNNLDFPVVVYVWPSGQDLGAGYSQVGPAESAMESRRVVLAPKGSGDCVQTISVGCNVKKFVGNPGTRFDDSYSSLVTTSPTDNVYFNVGAWSQVAGNVLAAPGIFTSTSVSVMTKFFDRKNFTT